MKMTDIGKDAQIIMLLETLLTQKTDQLKENAELRRRVSELELENQRLRGELPPTVIEPVEKKRSGRRPRFNEEQAERIRVLHKKMTPSAIATKYGVRVETILRVLNKQGSYAEAQG